MVEYLLGSFFVQSGKMTEQQLNAVLKKQDSVRVKLGLIAVSEGMMTSAQADEVNRLQVVMDKRFGDIAVEKGYLTDEQIGHLLKKQGNAYLSFAQALVDDGIVSMAEFNDMINDFKDKNNFSNANIEDLKSDDVDRIMPLFMPLEAEKYNQLAGVIVRTIVRFVNRHVYPGKAEMVNDYDGDKTAGQRMAGENGLISILSEGDGGLLELCSIFGQEQFDKLDEDSLDAAGEFLNCSNGLFVSSMSRDGHFLELMPPEYEKPDNGIKENSMCKIPLYLEGKKMYLILAELV